jgi:hypothetical protein
MTIPSIAAMLGVLKKFVAGKMTYFVGKNEKKLLVISREYFS